MNQRGSIRRECVLCGSPFRTHPFLVKRGQGRFCSVKCGSQRPSKPLVLRTCLSCDKEFLVMQFKIGQEFGRFCSVKCSKSGRYNPKWKGDERTHLQYIKVSGRKTVAHRWIVELAINRLLGSDEVVHHIDQNPKNNEIENLYVFRHQAAHARWHCFIRRHKLDGGLLKSNLPDLCAQVA